MYNCNTCIQDLTLKFCMTIPSVGTDTSTVLELVKSQQTTLTLSSEIVSHLTHLCFLLHLFTSLYFLPVQRTCICSIHFLLLQVIICYSLSFLLPQLFPLYSLLYLVFHCSLHFVLLQTNYMHCLQHQVAVVTYLSKLKVSTILFIHPLKPDDLAIEIMLSDQSLWEDLKTDNEVVTSESPYVSSNTPFNSPPFVPPPPKQSSFTHHTAPEQSLFTLLSVPEFSSGHPPVPRPSIQPPTAPEQSLFTPLSAPEFSSVHPPVPRPSIQPPPAPAEPFTSDPLHPAPVINVTNSSTIEASGASAQ